MQLPKLRNRIMSSGRLAKAIIGIGGAGIFLAAVTSAWLMLVFRGFVASVRASYEPMPFFLQWPTLAAILIVLGLVALAGACLAIASFRRPPPNSSCMDSSVKQVCRS